MRRKMDICVKCGKERLIYGNGKCRACWAYDYRAKQIKKSMSKPKKRTKKKKSIPRVGKSNRAKLIRKLDTVFSELRKLESMKPNQKIDCFTCDRELTMEEAQLGHFRRRRHIGTRWYKPNGNIQCNRCNVILDGNEDVHEQRIEQVYGPETLEEIFRRSRVTKVTNEKLEELLQTFTQQLNQKK